MKNVCGVLGLAMMAASCGGSAAGQARQPQWHVIYLHGRIVQEQQDPRPRHPDFGMYELESILEALRGAGFVVSGEIRPRAVSVEQWADRTVDQVRGFLGRGVPASRITVVGASMGGGIALQTAVRLQNPDVRFAVLGVCLSAQVPRLVSQEGKGPVGRVLSIREASDETTEPCERWTSSSAGSGFKVRELVLRTGLRHGFLYRPLPEWVQPVTEWAKTPAP
ncbi:MAG: hypothetical protein AB1806_12320 [Acidobacteriota bacterium]